MSIHFPYPQGYTGLVKERRHGSQSWKAWRIPMYFLLGMSLCLLIVACGGSTTERQGTAPSQKSSTANCQLIEHELGKTKVCEQPQKIVVLNPNMLEMLLSLGVQPAGYGDILPIHQGDFNNPSQQIPYLGERVTSQPLNVGTSATPSLEAIAKLQPDLILGSIEEVKQRYDVLSQIAPTLLFRYRGADNWQQSIQAIAQALGRTEQAQQVIETHKNRLTAAREALAPVAQKYPKVLMLASENLEQSLQIANSTDFCGNLMEDVGFQLVSVPGQQQQPVAQNISIEALPKLDADLIIVQGHNFGAGNQLTDIDTLENNQLKSLKQEWSNNAIAQSLEASQKGHVYFIPTYLCRGLPGPIGAEIFLDRLQKMRFPTD